MGVPSFKETPIYQYHTTILLCQAGHLRSRPHETFCKFAAFFFLIRKSCIPYEQIAMRIVGAGWWWYNSPYEIACFFVWDVSFPVRYTVYQYTVYRIPLGETKHFMYERMIAVTMSLEWLLVTGVSSCNLAATRGHKLDVSSEKSLTVPGFCWGSKVDPPSLSKW